MYRCLLCFILFANFVEAQKFEIVVVPAEYSLEKDIIHVYMGMPNPIYLDFEADLDSFRFETNNGKIITSINIIREYFLIPDKPEPVTIKATAFFSNRKIVSKTRTFTTIPPPNLGLQVKANKAFTSGIVTLSLIDLVKKTNVEKNYIIGAYEVDIERAGKVIIKGVFSGNLLVNISKMEDVEKAKSGDILKIKQIRLLDVEKNLPAYTQPFETKL